MFPVTSCRHTSKLSQCWLDAGSKSATLAQHLTSTGLTSHVFCGVFIPIGTRYNALVPSVLSLSPSAQSLPPTPARDDLVRKTLQFIMSFAELTSEYTCGQHDPDLPISQEAISQAAMSRKGDMLNKTTTF